MSAIKRDYDQMKATMLVAQSLPGSSSRTVCTAKVGRNHLSGYTSDDDLASPRMSRAFTRRAPLCPHDMTVVCDGQNLKGGDLVRIVHTVLKDHYDEGIDLACEYEKDIGGAVINPPNYKGGVIHPRSVTDWVFTLGGWKGMMPDQEVPAYFFDAQVVDINFGRAPGNPKSVPKFRGVEIGGMVFPIRDHRLHFESKFEIGSFEVTRHYTGTKTDLSYVQIDRAIQHIKHQFGLSDQDLAHFQLGLFYGIEFFKDDDAIDRVCGLADQNLKDLKLVLMERWGWVRLQETQNRAALKQVRAFFDYLNALMFGIEPSGLNAGFLIGLMTLELIAEGRLNYKQAFYENESGGMYPYATWGGSNRGTYRAREALLSGSPSMRAYRSNANLSPVAVKEAMLIRLWYTNREEYARADSHDEASQKLAKLAQDLVAANGERDIVHSWFGLSRH